MVVTIIYVMMLRTQIWHFTKKKKKGPLHRQDGMTGKTTLNEQKFRT